MPDQTLDFFYWDTGQCVHECCISWLNQNTGPAAMVGNPELSVAHGYRCVEFDVDLGSYVRHHRFITLELASDEKMPLRALLNKAQFAAPHSSYWYEDPAYWESFTELADAWEAGLGVLYYQIVDGWTYGFSEEPAGGRITAAGGLVGSARFIMPCLSDGEATSYQISLYAYDATVIVDGSVRAFAPPAITTSVGGAGFPSGPLEQIALALRDIAHKNTVVQLNNNGAIAVIDSGEVITP